MRVSQAAKCNSSSSLGFGGRYVGRVCERTCSSLDGPEVVEVLGCGNSGLPSIEFLSDVEGRGCR